MRILHGTSRRYRGAEDFTIHRRGEKPVGDPFWGSVWLLMDDDWTILEDEK